MANAWDAAEEKALVEGRFEDAIALHVARVKHVSFPGIQRVLERHMVTAGSLAFVKSRHPNLIFWAGMSPEWWELMRVLVESRRIYIHPSSVFVYMVDGCLLKYPVAKSLKCKGDHWVPVTFCSFPHKSAPKDVWADYRKRAAVAAQGEARG